MPYNTKSLKQSYDRLPVAQYFNPTIDDYEVLEGAYGGSKVLLYDVNGNPLFTQANPGLVQLTGSNVAPSQPASMQNVIPSTAGTAKYINADGSLNPKASDRIICIKNNGDQQATVLVYPYHSAVGHAGTNVSVNLTVATNAAVYVTNGQLNEIAAPFDSFGIGVTYATLPGNSQGINVYVVENGVLI